MARMTPEALEKFLAEPHVGVLATLSRSGVPYQIPISFLWHGGAFWLTGTHARRWCKNLLQDPRCSLCIEAYRPRPRYVTVRCLAEPVEQDQMDIWAVMRLMAEKYMRSEDIPAMLARIVQEPRLLFKLRPERWQAVDLTVYTGTRGDRAYQAGARAQPPSSVEQP